MTLSSDAGGLSRYKKSANKRSAGLELAARSSLVQKSARAHARCLFGLWLCCVFWLPHTLSAATA